MGEDEGDMLGTESTALCSLGKGEERPVLHTGRRCTLQKQDQLSKTAEMIAKTEMGISGKAQGPSLRDICWTLDQKQRTEQQGQREQRTALTTR